MSKVICDICGTSYPETATQCPICGCVRPAEAVAVADSAEETAEYTYVKGGRFSKANVRKRHQAAQAAAVAAGYEPEEEDKSGNKKIISLVIILSLLVLIVGFMIAYLFIKFPDIIDFGSKQTETTEISCTGIILSEQEITLEKDGFYKLELSVTPSNTTDEIIFKSSDNAVVTVSESGKISYVGAGEATITVTCGKITAQCQVTCAEEEPEETTTPPTETEPPAPTITLDRENIEGDDVIAGAFQWPLYQQGIHGDLLVTDITWISDNEAVATVDANGVVYAQGEGTTIIRAMYNGKILAICSITCIEEAEIDDSQEGGTTEPTQPSTTSGDLTPYTQYGKTYAESEGVFSISLSSGESVDLFLKDADGNKVSVTWSVVEGDCTMGENGSTVTVNSEKTCKVKAEHNGNTYYVVIF